MKPIKLLITLLTSLPFSISAATPKKQASQPSNQLILSSVDTESTKDSSIVSILFNDSITNDSVALSEHGSFIQIEIKGSQAAKPGTFIDSTSPYFKKIAIFQPDENSSSIRIFSEHSDLIKKMAKLDVIERRVVLTLGHSEMESALQPVAAAPAQPTEADAAMALAATQISEESKSKVAALTTPTLAVASESNLAKSMSRVSLLIAVLMILGLVAFYMKGVIKSRRSSSNPADTITMKRLSSMALNTKQQLSLIEVGGEKLLLAISNDQVSLLTHIQGNQEKIRVTPTNPITEISTSPQRKALLPMQSRNQPQTEQPITTRKTMFESSLTNDGSDKKSQKGSRINLKIDDQGAKQNSDSAIRDVTDIIRQKMKDLPKF